MLRTAPAFAQILARNGGGAIVNMLSGVSRYVDPSSATHSTSKYAAYAVANALWVQFKAQRTRVLGIYARFINIDEANQLSGTGISKG